ncbi:hypothetical protein EYF80_018825 [Liparis tanakae]|uniref:Uncharacterized protein n=1 Tax=Liparis tanakae TaxID=230148 RepID=A0A4Z2HYS3_9TELE|nr:hypothetical protein EYF80_018825 [Liparis tanakae]
MVECGNVVISSAVISPRARHSIDLTRRSLSREVTDHHPMAERPGEVIDCVTLDPAPSDPLTPGSGPAGVWRRDAGLIDSRDGGK